MGVKNKFRSDAVAVENDSIAHHERSNGALECWSIGFFPSTQPPKLSASDKIKSIVLKARTTTLGILGIFNPNFFAQYPT